jgi:hypothetical protein
VPFAKHKAGRSPVQRLSDQRRSLALAGLAAGAVVSAAVLRRKRRGEEAEFEPPAPPLPTTPESPTAPPVSPPVTGAAPPPADAESTPAGSSAPLVEPATGELSAEEASILSVLAQHGRGDDDRTAIAVATSLERDTADVTTVLRKLGAEGVVSGELYTAAGDKIWAVTERGVRRLGAQH